MAYSSTNPPKLLMQGIGGIGPNIWTYKSTDAVATVCGSSYVSNGASLGMKQFDMVFVANTASTLASLCWVGAVTSGAGATISSTLTTT